MGPARAAARAGPQRVPADAPARPEPRSPTRAFPTKVVRAFVAEAVEAGIDIFRIFDALNDIEGMRAAIEATLETPALAEGTLCYTGDLSDPREQLYTLDYYLRLAEQLVDAGVHMLAIKDMAGLLRAPAARTLVTALRSEFELPVHLHTHDTAGGQLATYLAAIDAGVDAIDGAAAPMAGMTSQPSLAAIVAATATTERDSGIALDALLDQEPYWESVRTLYGAFETGLKAPTGRVYRHEIPGGQLSNLRQQADAVGPRGPLRRDRTRLRASQPPARQPGQGHAFEQGRRRPRPVRGFSRPRLRRARTPPRLLRPPRLRHRLPARRNRHPTRRLSTTLHRPRTRRSHRPRRTRGARRRARRATTATRRTSPRGARRDPLPRTGLRLRRRPRPVRRRLADPHARILPRPARRRGTGDRSRPRRPPALRARSHR